jgi:hypothetical protein
MPQTKVILSLPKYIQTWICHHIKRPIAGFEHKRRPDGSFLTIDEQLTATYQQITYTVQYFLSRGKSDDDIMKILHSFVR